MVFLLFFLGLLIIGFVHLIVPICFALGKKQRKKSTLWIIAIVGGVVGFVVCFIMQEEFRGLAGVVQSAFWTVIAYFILRRRCYQKEQYPKTFEQSTPREEDAKAPTFSLSFPDEKPTAYGNFHIRGSDVALEKPNIKCLKCGMEVPSDSSFCQYCGTEIPQTKKCAYCGAELTDGMRFCAMCGKQVFSGHAAQPAFPQKNRRKKWPIFCIIGVVVVLLVVGIWFAVTSSSGDAPAPQNNKISIEFSPGKYYVGIRTITIEPVNLYSNSDDSFAAEYYKAKAWSEAKESAEKIYREWRSGDATETSLISVMDQHGAEQGGGQLHIILPGEMVEEIDDWCFDPSRKAGDSAIIETAYGYSICFFSGKVIKSDAVDDFTQRKAANQALEIDRKYGPGAYGGSEWLNQRLVESD